MALALQSTVDNQFKEKRNNDPHTVNNNEIPYGNQIQETVKENSEALIEKLPEAGLEKEEGVRVKTEKSVRRLGGELLGC